MIQALHSETGGIISQSWLAPMRTCLEARSCSLHFYVRCYWACCNGLWSRCWNCLHLPACCFTILLRMSSTFVTRA